MASREDEVNILTSLGAIDIKPVDYDQWKRKVRKKRVQKILTTTSPSRILPDNRFNSNTTFHKRSCCLFEGPSSLSICNHSHKRTDPLSELSNDRVDCEQQKEIKVLVLLIKSRREAVQNYKSRQEVLLNENEKLQKEIEGAEATTHKDVKQLLQKYERYRCAVSTLTSKFDKEKTKAVMELKTSQDEINAELKSLEKQLAEVKQLLTDKRAELSILVSYKDKEYPVKAMKINTLKKQVEQLANNFETEKFDLENIIAIEQEKYKIQGEENIENIKSEATENAITSMHESLKDMALQNMIMKKEIEEHMNGLVKLEKYNEKLKEEVEALKVSPEINVRQQMFPHLYRTMQKCTPDMEIVLDIPIQDWLPV